MYKAPADIYLYESNLFLCGSSPLESPFSVTGEQHIFEATGVCSGHRPRMLHGSNGGSLPEAELACKSDMQCMLDWNFILHWVTIVKAEEKSKSTL